MCEQLLREGLQDAQLRPSHISKSNATFQGKKEENSTPVFVVVDNNIALVCLILAEFLKTNLYHYRCKSWERKTCRMEIAAFAAQIKKWLSMVGIWHHLWKSDRQESKKGPWRDGKKTKCCSACCNFCCFSQIETNFAAEIIEKDRS